MLHTEHQCGGDRDRQLRSVPLFPADEDCCFGVYSSRHWLPGPPPQSSANVALCCHPKVELLGQESTKVIYTTTRTVRNSDGTVRTVYDYHDAYGSRQIVQVQVPVQQHHLNDDVNTPGKVLPGRYVVPFQIELPQSLPSSVDHSNSDGGYLKLHYQIKANLQGSGLLFDCSATQVVTVLSAPPSASTTTTNYLVPYCGEPAVEPINFCCCWNRGVMILGVWTDTTILFKGSTAMLRMACRNESSVQAQNVQAQLMERLIWHADGHSATATLVLAQASFGTEPLQVGMKPKSRDEMRQSRADSNLQRSLAQNDRVDILSELQAGTHQQRMTIPVQAKSTYVGALMTIRHELWVWITVTGCCLNNPTVIIPVTVVESPPPGAAPPLLPSTPFPLPSNGTLPSGPTGEGDVVVDPTLLPMAAHTLPSDFVASSSSGVVYTPVIEVGSHNASLGGLAGGGPTEEEITIPASSVPTSSSPSTGDLVAPPGLARLLAEMQVSIAGEDIVERALADSTWDVYMSTMSPTDYGTVLQTIQLSLQQLGVAESLAGKMISSSSSTNNNPTNAFSCDHVKAAVGAATSLNRTAMVTSLLPRTCDAAERHKIVCDILTDWEKELTRSTFDRFVTTEAAVAPKPKP